MRDKKQQIAKLAARGNTVREIEAITGIPKSTVHSELQAIKESKEYQQFQSDKDKIFETIQLKLIDNLGRDKLNSMSGLQLITGTAILEDKIRAIRGQATEIVDHRHLVVDLDRAVEALRGMQPRVSDGQSDDVIDAQVITCPTQSDK